MGIISGLGGLLGGASNEAHTIHEERFQKEQADRKMATDMLQNMLSDPRQTDPNILSQVSHAYRDLVMESVFPDQFKRDKTNPVHKLIDQFIGMQSGPSAAMQGAQKTMSQIGAGSGNATSSVGAAQPPQGGPPAPPPSMIPPATGSLAGGVPPSPAEAGLVPPQSTGGYVNPFEAAAYSERASARIKAEETNRGKAAEVQQSLQALQATPAYQQADAEGKAEMVAGIFGSHYTRTPIAEISKEERYDPETNKTMVYTMRNTAQGLVPDPGVKPYEKEPSERERLIADDAKSIVSAAKSNPKDAYLKAYAGKSEPEVRAKIHLDQIRDQELDRQIKMANVESNIGLRKYYEENIKSLVEQREQAPLIRAADAVDKESEARVNKDVADWQNNSIDLPATLAQKKTVFKPQPDRAALKERYFDEISKERGIDPNVLRRAVYGLGKGMSGDVWMQAPSGEVKSVPFNEVDHYKALGAKVVTPNNIQPVPAHK